MTSHYFEPTEQERRFISSLKTLVARDDRGALAALRRGLGKAPGEATEMYPWVAWALSADGYRAHDDDYFTVASLFASHYKKPWEDAPHHVANLGASFRALYVRREQGPSIEARFVGLLGASREQLPNHLRGAISLMKADEIPVCWEYLLHDLGRWTWEGQRVQRAWGRAFWGHGTTLAAPQTESTDDER
jgi:CRISPR system Cascade subunit CasB